MTDQDYARNDYRGTAPWYTSLIYFMSTVLMCYVLLWLVDAYVDTGDCWAMAESFGCAVVLKQ